MKERGNHLHENHRERMRERIKCGGINALKDHEVLEYLLYPFVPRKDTNPLAHKLIEKYGTFGGVLRSSYEELLSVRGMTQNAALFLTSLLEISQRSRLSVAWEVPLEDSYAVAEFGQELFDQVDQERIYLVCLDSSCQTVATAELARGNLEDCELSDNMVLALVNRNAKYAYIMHNHLEDEALPSENDKKFTDKIAEKLRVVGVELKDHIIVGYKTVFSFAFYDYLAE